MGAGVSSTFGRQEIFDALGKGRSPEVQGHIPGAVSMYWTELQVSPYSTWKPIPELQRLVLRK